MTRSNQPRTLLEQVARQVAILEEPAQQQNIAAAAEILAGLRFEKTLLRQLFREELMKESVVYQDILQKGIAQGQQQGLQQGLQQGEALVIIRLLSRRFGRLTRDLEQKIYTLSISELDELIDAQLDFSSVEDLVTWLEAFS